MSMRYRSNYSLWPEQSRPRRAIPITLAIGGFSIGIVCAVAAHNVVTDFLRPTAPPDVAEEGALAHVPIYATAAAPAAVDSGTVTRGRSRSVAKVTLPSIGTRGPLPSAATDGRGGDGRVGDALGSEMNAAASAQAVANAPIPAPAPESVAEIKPADETAPAASEPPKAKRKARTHRTAKKRRSTPSNYAYRNQNNFFGWGGYGGGQYHARQQYYGRRQYYY